MFWESVLGIVVFSALVLFAIPGWWSSNLGMMKKLKQEQPPKAESPRQGVEPPGDGGPR